MDESQFQSMWEKMQSEGYFDTHPHYSADLSGQLTKADMQLDRKLCELDFSTPEVVFPVPYSESLERSVKRTESVWLPRMFRLPAGGAALDVGCGYGRSIKWMTGVYDEVVGVDISQAAINSATERLRDLDNVRLYVCSANRLPAQLEAGYFSFAYAFTVFQHIPRDYTLQLLIDIHRVLKDGGQVAFNMVSGVNEQGNDGVPGTEWSIGYSAQAVSALLSNSGFEPSQLFRWSEAASPVSWLWVLAQKRTGK